MIALVEIDGARRALSLVVQCVPGRFDEAVEVTEARNARGSHSGQLPEEIQYPGGTRQRRATMPKSKATRSVEHPGERSLQHHGQKKQKGYLPRPQEPDPPPRARPRAEAEHSRSVTMADAPRIIDNGGQTQLSATAEPVQVTSPVTKVIVVVATGWGPLYGGINSFSFDFSLALGRMLRTSVPGDLPDDERG